MNKSMLSKENLLILSGHFPDKKGKSICGVFVKEQLRYISKYFKTVYVVVPTPRNPAWLAKLFELLPDSVCPTYSRVLTDDVYIDHSYENVHVKYLKYWHIPANFFRNKLGTKYFNLARSFLKKTNKQFSVVHSHFSYPAGFAGAEVGKYFKVPSVLTVHEAADWLKQEIESDNPGLSHSWGENDKVIRVSNCDIKSLEQFTSKDKLIYITNGYDSTKFVPQNKKQSRKKLGLPQDKKIFVNVAALVEYKNHGNLLDAVHLASKKRDDLLFFVVGAGPLKDKLEAKAANLGISHIIKFVGLKPHSQIPLWLSAADAFVLSSDQEGNPTVMFEALGCGRPYVGTVAGGVTEVIKKPAHGLLCPLRDSNGLSKIILKACDVKWSEKNISDFSHQYSWKSIASQVVDVYLQLLKK